MPLKLFHDEACNVRRQNISRSICIGRIILLWPFLIYNKTLNTIFTISRNIECDADECAYLVSDCPFTPTERLVVIVHVTNVQASTFGYFLHLIDHCAKFYKRIIVTLHYVLCRVCKSLHQSKSFVFNNQKNDYVEPCPVKI